MREISFFWVKSGIFLKKFCSSFQGAPWRWGRYHMYGTRLQFPSFYLLFLIVLALVGMPLCDRKTLAPYIRMYLKQAPEHLKSSISSICIGCKRQTFNPVHDIWQIQSCMNPHLPSGPVHPYQLDESIYNFRGGWCTFSFLFYFEYIFLLANREDPDQTPRSTASDLGLHCLPMSQKWDIMFIWVKSCIYCNLSSFEDISP